MMRRFVCVVATLVTLTFMSPVRAQFNDSTTWAGTGSGSANTQTALLANAAALSDVLGVAIKYVPVATNTGAATFTLNGLTPTAIQRPTPSGMAALGGGEIVSGHAAILIYNGSVFDLQNSARPEPPGAAMDYVGASCPTGFTAANAGSISPGPLYTVLGTIWGSAGTLPDLRGRATFGQDSGGSNRITTAGGNCDGTTIGTACGAQNRTLAQSALPNVTLTVNAYSTGSASVRNDINQIGVQPNNTGGATTSSINGGVTQTAVPTLSNAAIVNKCVRF